MDAVACTHFNSFLMTPNNVRTFCNIYAMFVKPATRRNCVFKAQHCLCSVCNEHSPRLHVCLFCIFFGCYDAGHIQAHVKSEQHFLALDIAHGHTFCFECGYYVYSEKTFKLTESLQSALDTTLVFPQNCREWFPVWSELALLAQNPIRREVTENSTTGLTGLVNLGNTCFMNCIVQALMHTPFLKSYFLSHLHACSIEHNCIVCEVGHLFQEYYSGKKRPLNLHKLLQLIWSKARRMADYEQQDAHEFFIAALDILHRHSGGEPNQAKSIYSFHCSCIIDQIFTGGLQSDVVCQACKNVSTTIDPFWDISLDIGTDTHSLVECLERFTQAEHLGKIKCSNCDSYQESTKQLTMHKLPLVASFHLKRFKQTSHIGKKILAKITFPAELDMAPFLTRARNATPGEAPSQRCAYSLFAVTNHVGTMDSGHYTAFVRHLKNSWYKCDDHLITRSNLSHVLRSQGYQLFYKREIIDYE